MILNCSLTFIILEPRFPSKSENINIASPTDSDDEESKPNDVILQKFMDSLLPK